jgi:O-antigen/teichoic acid export membrane protein
LSNTKYNALATITTLLTTLIVSGYASRKLGVEDFGRAQYLIWLVQTGGLIVGLGMPTTVSRFVAMYAAKGDLSSAKSILAIAWLLCLPASTIGGIVVYVSVAGNIAALTGLVLVLGTLQALQLAACAGFGNYQSILKAAAAGSLLSLAAAFIFIDRYGIAGFLLVYAVAATAQLIVMVFALRGQANGHAATPVATIRLKEIASFAGYAWLASIISVFVWQRMELYFIDRYLSSTDVAYFSVAITLGALISQPMNILGSALLPYFSAQLSSVDGLQRSAQLYVLLTKLFAWVSFFAAFVLAAHSGFLVTLVFGEAYIGAEQTVSFILAGSAFGTIASVGSALVYSAGRARFIFFSGVFGAAFTVLAGVTLVPSFGVIGAATSKILIQLVMIAAGTVYIVQRLVFPFPLQSYCKSLASAAIAAAVPGWVIGQGGITSLIVSLILSLLMYLALTRIVGVFTPADVNAIKAALSRIRR